MGNRLLVDENAGPNTPVWQAFQKRFGARAWECVFLSQAHPGIPDVEILDKLLTADAVLLTGDRVLHAFALARGHRSYTLDPHGNLTSRPLPGVRPPVNTPKSVYAELQEEYRGPPRSGLSSSLKRDLTESRLKGYRTARRRMRSHFGSAAAITQVSVTIGATPAPSGLLCGFVIRLAGKSGVKGLKATEGYRTGTAGEADEACPVLYALRELYLLQLERVRTELFVIPPRSLELTRRLLAAGPPPAVLLHTALQRLLGELATVSASPCVKGFFHDEMRNKLHALARRPTNEVVRLDFERVARSVLEAGGSTQPG
jgi:hypothetical protein